MYQRVSALLNPLVRPQSIVAVEYALDDNDDVLFNTMRVREATYKGNNKNGDWVWFTTYRTNNHNIASLILSYAASGQRSYIDGSISISSISSDLTRIINLSQSCSGL